MTKVLNNNMLLPLFAVIVTLYSVMIVPKLNLKNLDLLNNMSVKLLLVIGVYYLSTKNKMYGVILSVAILLTVLGLKATTKVLSLTTKPSDSTNLTMESNTEITHEPTVLSPLRSDIIKKAFDTKNELSQLLSNTNDNTTQAAAIKTDMVIQDHIIDSALNEKNHLQLMTTPSPTEPNIEFHKKNASLYKIKLESLLNSVNLRKLLNDEANKYDNDTINELLLLLNHENNKIDLVSNIQNELNNGIIALENDNSKAVEHFENINNYEIELAEKLRLENLEHIKKYYESDNFNNRQSNEYTNVEPVMTNYDDASTLA